MTKLPLAPFLYPPLTIQTPPTFISTLRADGTLISVTLREMGFFTVPSKEQSPNSARKLARKKNDGVSEIWMTEVGICETIKLFIRRMRLSRN